jgi:hypothetical protein
MPARVGSGEGLGVTLCTQPPLEVDSVGGAAVHARLDAKFVISVFAIEASCSRVVLASLDPYALGAGNYCTGF